MKAGGQLKQEDDDLAVIPSGLACFAGIMKTRQGQIVVDRMT
jgi:hypothetical protein